ncbi:hypothetical protein [Bradyrhizobium australiense]|uniref:Uncharacterized protein n=1 Tax=Bradyrhizobium australiense TaxID=2721161 RepID=A0A7Y4GQU3_9BRAD|nr:hypothetical protein [Bradyrhizobium australiense]NOJ40285.1 hypothetical protein [Bradyrhizobium australiense]
MIAAGINQQLVAAILKAYDLDRMKLTLKDLSPSEASQALQAKQAQALLVVMPISEKYLAMLGESFRATQS